MTNPSSRVVAGAAMALVAAMVVLSGAGCTPLEPRATRGPAAEGTGVYHTVRKGETLWRISQAYDVSVAEIVESNGLPDYTISVGQRLFIPGATEPRRTEARDVGAGDEAAVPAGHLTWPLAGRSRPSVGSGFGERTSPTTGGREFHRGIDIPAPREERVLAAAAGEIVYAGKMSGFGIVVMIDHGNRLITVYAHLSRTVVRLEEVVERGQTVGYVGDSGRTTGTHLHFEVRSKGVPADPLRYLP
jgi:murein DD-endopeptidase MepM/ murein hydrolase activator NlpD